MLVIGKDKTAANVNGATAQAEKELPYGGEAIGPRGESQRQSILRNWLL